MKAAVTGATGLLGGNLAAELLDAGWDVRCTRRQTSRIAHLDGLPIEWVIADLSDPGGLEAAFRDVDVVFHCAAQVVMSWKVTPAMEAANITGTANVLDAVATAGADRLVHCSSTVAVGLSEDGEPVDETCEFNTARLGYGDGYVTTKRRSEEMAIARDDVDVVVVNPGFMFGPMDVKPGSGKMIVEIANGRNPFYSPGRNSFVDARDVARGMIAAAKKGVRGDRYILGGENIGYRDIMQRIAKVADVRAPSITFPRWLAMLVGRIADLVEVITKKEQLLNTVNVSWGYCDRFLVSSDKARRELGYTTRPIEESIADALAWFREHGMV